MGGKQRKRDLVTAFLRKVGSLPGVEVQVYRHGQDYKKPPKYLGTLEPEREVELEFLVDAHATELDLLIPNVETQRLWGGGKYEFRFFWRDEEGRIEQKRSRIGHIGGYPLPK